MTHRSLAEVGLCLCTLQEDMDPATPPQDQFDAIESVAIAILDSEFDQYLPGALEEYLRLYLGTDKLKLSGPINIDLRLKQPPYSTQQTH